MIDQENPIFCAIDTPDLVVAKACAAQLSGHVGGLKLGLEFFTANGPAGVQALTAFNAPIFLDLKLHDIPNTVAKTVKALAPLAPKIMTLHTGGGAAMMREAKEASLEACGRLGIVPPVMVGVTILTSLDQQDIERVGFHRPVKEQVLMLASLAKESGLDGIVCSPHEIAAVRAECGNHFKLVVPGIRPKGAELGDQKRVMTPREAVEAGATYLVIGRPITGASNPAEAAKEIVASLS